jgi:hypothetical protein
VCAIIGFRCARVAIIWNQLRPMAGTIANPSANQQEVVYRYAKAHPGEVYFPWNNLSTPARRGNAVSLRMGRAGSARCELGPDPAADPGAPSAAHPLRRVLPQGSELRSDGDVSPGADAPPLDELPGFIVFAVR